MTKSRDPRTDPLPDDVVENASGVRRIVVYVSPDVGESYRYGDDPVTVVYDVVRNGKHQNQNLCGLKAWRRWAKGSRVVRKARNLEPVGTQLSVTILRSLSQQLLWFNNKYGEKAKELDLEIQCALTEDVALAFMELGIVHALKCSTGTHALFKMIAHQVRRRRSYRLPDSAVHEESCDMGVDCYCAASQGVEEVPEEVAARPDEHEA